MKKYILPLAALAFSTSLFSQSNLSFEFIDIAGVRARIHADGQLFQDKTNGRADYEVPKGSGNHAIYSSAFWMSSKGNRNNFPHISVGYESFGFGNFFRTGPVDLVNQKGDTTPQFQRLWKINKSEIDNHIANWNSGSYTTPNSILDWPGNGNQNTAKVLAPFQDLDNDSIYEPQDGEYPIIKGDQAVYTISNSYQNIYGDSLTTAKRDSTGNILRDSTGNVIMETYSSFSPMKIETHMMVYAYASNNIDISNTVFVNVKMYNRSNSTQDDHQNFRLSVYSDFDLGAPFDDYVGTDTTHNMVYAYNGDSFDDSFAGAPGYGSNLPSVGVKFLDNDLLQSMYFQSGSANNGDPVLFEHYVNYQRSAWKNGQPLYYGGDGFYNCVDTNTTTNFMFSGDPTLLNDTTQWTESNPCLTSSSTNFPNPPGDRRIIGGPNLPNQFNHGTSIEFNYAYIFAQSTTSNSAAVDKLKVASDTVQAFFNKNLLVGLDKTQNSTLLEFDIYPNPANQMVSIKTDQKPFDVELINLQGQTVIQHRNENKVDVSPLSNGIYFIRISSKDKIGVKRLIISK